MEKDDRELFDQVFEAVSDAIEQAMEPFEGDARVPSMAVQTIMTIVCNIFVAEGGSRDEFLAAATEEFDIALEEAAILLTADEYGSN